MGAVVKDPRRGLLDFYGRVDGKLVWLCWQYGEDEVSHYHGLEEGFPGRKEIAHSIKQRLLELGHRPESSVDRPAAEQAILEFLRALGRDPLREPELRGTPARVVAAYVDELCNGYGYRAVQA